MLRLDLVLEALTVAHSFQVTIFLFRLQLISHNIPILRKTRFGYFFPQGVCISEGFKVRGDIGVVLERQFWPLSKGWI